MRRIGEYEAPKRRIGFSHAPQVEMEQEGGIGPCHAQPCRFGGTIQCGSKWWYCRFHVNRPPWAEKVVSDAMLSHSVLAQEVLRGFNLASNMAGRTNEFFETRMLQHTERLIPCGYSPKMELIEHTKNKLWSHDYAAFARAMDVELSTKIGEVIRQSKGNE